MGYLVPFWRQTPRYSGEPNPPEITQTGYSLKPLTLRANMPGFPGARLDDGTNAITTMIPKGPHPRRKRRRQRGIVFQMTLRQ